MTGIVLELAVSGELVDAAEKQYHFLPEDRDLLAQVGRDVEGAARQGARFWIRMDAGRGQAAAALTLGAGVDALQEEYGRTDRLLECYMAEVLADELMRSACGRMNEWIWEHAGLRVARYRFFGEDPALLPEDMPAELARLGAEGIRCNRGFCLIPKKSLAMRLELSADPQTACASVCSGCSRKDCPNRREGNFQ